MRIGQKLKNGLRMGAKIGGLAAVAAGTYIMGQKAGQAKDYAQLQANNAQVLQQQGVAGAQAVIGAGPLGAQSMATQQAAQVGALANLAGSGEDVGAIVANQRAQQLLVQDAIKASQGGQSSAFSGLKAKYGFGG